MELIPFDLYDNKRMNYVYTFRFYPQSKPIEHLENSYKTKIEIDEANDGLLVSTKCTCPGYKFRKRCIHIKEAKKILKKHNIKFREENDKDI